MADRVRQNLIFAHQEWLGFVQPVGLVVAPTVMIDAQVVPDRNISGRQQRFVELLEKEEGDTTTRWHAPDLKALFLDYLEWEDNDLIDASAHREELEVALPELGVVLSSTWAVPYEDSENSWVMLIHVEEGSANLDKPPQDTDTWNATRHARFERLLRETGIPIGLLCNAECIRLVYAPEGESSGHITFNLAEMASTAGRPILAAFDMLLSADALFAGAETARLPTLLVKSREAQVEVSTQLSRQVLAALYELLRGFVAADVRIGKDGIKELALTKPEHLYHGLITALMRLVFVLYTEDRGLMPDHPVYQQHYSLGGLFTRLRTDAAAWPDTMDQRFGAWAQLLSLFRLIHGGGRHENLFFVPRKGGLFDPERFPFLEGRTAEDDLEIPMISDAIVWTVLRNLMILDGERLSYRTLDVEQIGSVYEAIMGFRIELTTGRSIAVRSKKRTGAAVVVDLDQLLHENGSKRAKELLDATDQKLTGKETTTLSDAVEPLDVVALLDRKVDREATPSLLPKVVPILQPTSERRRSGSHYTPRTLTEPIVSEALQPVFKRLGSSPRPEEILELKILDPATGSGAFLVEACRQMATKLVEAWNIHGKPTEISTDEDQLLHALRLVAQRCLYGVDRNPMAIELARLSLWLATFAKDQEFTFIDHALRTGDSQVGLTRHQIEGFHWKADVGQFQFGIETIEVQQHLKQVSALRAKIREAGISASEQELRGILDTAQTKLHNVRQYADLVLAAFFGAAKSKEREQKRDEYALLIRQTAENPKTIFNSIKPPLEPFHWEIEYPEVFDSENPGFDAIVGNPPFAGKNTIASANVSYYPDWLKQIHVESHGNADLSAHFFRRAFNLLNDGGTLGLIATNTIAQGDTRSTGLRWIGLNGGTIYNAHRRIKWPGEAAVVVSFVHIYKGTNSIPCKLDDQEVDAISAFLFHEGGHEDPKRLVTNISKSFQGSIVLGMGFTFDDTDKKGIATPISEMFRLIEQDPRNKEVIFPYIGGEEVNFSPNQVYHRYVINFGDREEKDCWARYPDLMAIVSEKVKPSRLALPPHNNWNRDVAKRWWQFGADRQGLRLALSKLDRVLAISRVGQNAAFSFLPTGMVYAESLIVFPFDTYTAFSVIQSRIHEIWARFFGSSLEDRLRYTPSDCFETFPLPEHWVTHADLEAAGRSYYEFRASLMVRNNEGLTKAYNRFHDPNERDIEITKLRDLHTEMDRAVLDAYGWSDIPTDCGFFLDYEINEEEWGKKKKPWRYRWPDGIRDEVLARLMALNAERAQEERLAGRNVAIVKAGS